MGKVNTLIIGAGPTGLGAAWRLHEEGKSTWLLCDRNDYPGGLAASFKDEKGFTWDFAVHVAHSHYEYFDRLMDTLLPDGFYHHQRKSWVRLYDTWVPYPFQYNFHRLPAAARDACLEGLRARQVTKNAPTFYAWILSNFGQGIWKELYRRLPEANKRLSCGVTSLDAAAKTAILDDGTQVEYQSLVSTMPLKVLAQMVGDERIDLSWHPVEGVAQSV